MTAAIKKPVKKIKNLLSKEQTRILETAFILMLPILLSKVLGQLFQLVLASFYGVEDLRLRQFIIADTIPGLLSAVLMVGAVGSVTIPVLVASKEEDGEKKFFRLYSSILNSALLVTVVVGILIMIFAGDIIPWAIQIFDPDLPPSQAEIDNMANMMRALIVPQLFLGISTFVSVGLNIYDRYLLPQMSQLFFNAGKLGTFFLLVSPLDLSPWAIVAGVYVGAFLHLIIQLPLFNALKIKYQFTLDWRDKNFSKIWKLAIPRIAVLASDHVAFVINKFLSLAFVGGTVALNYAYSLYFIVPSVIGATFSYASYPTISRLVHKKDYSKLINIVHKTINQIAFLSIPFVVTIMVLRISLVRLFFGLIPGTSLSLEGTYQVAWILLGFSVGLIFVTSRWFILNLFYASKNTWIPSVVAVFSFVSVIGLSVLLTNFFSHATEFSIVSIDWSISNFFERSTSKAGIIGISLAMSIVYTIEFFVLIFLFDRFRLDIQVVKLFKSLRYKLYAGGAMLGFMYFTYKLWNAISFIPDAASSAYRGSTTINLIVLTTITVIPAFLIYFLVCQLFKVDELKIFKRYLNPVFKLGGLKIK